MKLSERLKRNSDAAIARQPMPAREMEALPAAVPMVVPAWILNMPVYPYGRYAGRPLIVGDDSYRLNYYCRHKDELPADVRDKLREMIGYDPGDRGWMSKADKKAARRKELQAKRSKRKEHQASERLRAIERQAEAQRLAQIATNAVAELRALPYADYLQSQHWFRMRRQAVKKARKRCNRCGSKKQLNVHHKTYDRVGCEMLSDLEVLCRSCHAAEHGIKE